MATARCTLDDAIVRANARIWREAGGGQLRPVLKSNGYGWGVARLARLLEAEAAGFCVVDTAEFRALYKLTTRPISLLGFCHADEIAELLDHDALPNIATLAELDAVAAYANTHGRTVRIRAGLAPSLGWNGVAPQILQHFAERAAAQPFIELELWTHLTSPEAQQRELRFFKDFIATFRNYGARIVSVETASSSSLANGVDTLGGPLRIGIGVFGAHSHQLPDLRCALHLEADVIASQSADASLVAGYARKALPPGASVEVLRIGYGDGFPRGLAGCTIETSSGSAQIATIGMQHTVITHNLEPALSRTLLHPATDLLQLCKSAATSAHEVIVTLGLRFAAPTVPIPEAR